MVQEATRRGEGTVITLAQVALAALHNGLGDYRAALDAASGPGESGLFRKGGAGSAQFFDDLRYFAWHGQEWRV